MCAEMSSKSFLPMLVTNWVLGMGIIEYPPGNEYRVVSLLYSSFCLLSYFLVAAYAYPHFLSMATEFKASPVIMKVLFFSNLFVTTGSIVSGWKRSQGMRVMLVQTRNVDLLLEKIGVMVKYSRRFKIQVGVYVTRISFILILIIINSVSLPPRKTVQIAEIAVTIMLSYPILLIFIVDSTFINFVVCAFRQFQKLNDTLRHMLTSTEDFPQHKRLINAYLENKISLIDQINLIEVDATYTFDTAKKAHLELVHLCRQADEIFGSHILYSTIVSIGVTTGCLYQIYVLLPCTKIVGFNIYRVLLHNGIWVLYYIIKIIMFGKGCSTVVQEAITTGDIISEFYDEPSSSEKTRAVIREFHCHLIRNVISFNAHGFIKVDLTLIKVIIGSVTTYLMIFSQFGTFIVPNYDNSTCL